MKKNLLLLMILLTFGLTSCEMQNILENNQLNEDNSSETESEKESNETTETEGTKQELTENMKVLKVIKDTIYANNISAHFSLIDDNGEQMIDTWSINIEKDNLSAHVWSNEVEIDLYFKDDETGCEVYDNGEYRKVLDVNTDLYTMMPFPTFDNISYTNYGIYQDGVGQMTDIVSSKIEQMYYDSETGFYKIDLIYIEHGELDNYYATAADKLTFSYWVKLSSDNTYVETLIFDIIESEEGLTDLRVQLYFYDYNNTQLKLPE